MTDKTLKCPYCEYNTSNEEFLEHVIKEHCLNDAKMLVKHLYRYYIPRSKVEERIKELEDYIDKYYDAEPHPRINPVSRMDELKSLLASAKEIKK